MFIQLHALTSYPSALLNRDDAGFAKTIPFGGKTRTRISSQCLKRHWREHKGEFSLQTLDAPMAVRSRVTAEKHLYEPLLEEGINDAIAREVVENLVNILLDLKTHTGLETQQVVVLGPPELDHLRNIAREICEENPKDVSKAVQARVKQESDNLRALALGAGLDAALHGRFITGDTLANVDAAVHVAHAFTVHEHAGESDYFTAVDDLTRDVEHGAGHLGSSELTSGTYYSYVVVDVPLLRHNLSGNMELGREVIRRLVQIIATVSPGAKVGSTAPHSYASCMLIESGAAQPRTLAGAFERCVAPSPDMLTGAYNALAKHLTELDAMYGTRFERRVAGIGSVEVLKQSCGDALSIAALADWAAEQAQG
jgi:CRISPR system Cascade subunit CasC